MLALSVRDRDRLRRGMGWHESRMSRNKRCLIWMEVWWIEYGLVVGRLWVLLMAVRSKAINYVSMSMWVLGR